MSNDEAVARSLVAHCLTEAAARTHREAVRVLTLTTALSDPSITVEGLRQAAYDAGFSIGGQS